MAVSLLTRPKLPTAVFSRWRGETSKVACRSGHVCSVAVTHGRRMLMSQVADESTSSIAALPLSAAASHAQPASEATSRAPSTQPSNMSDIARTVMSPRQLYEAVVGAVDAASADAKKNIQLAVPELAYTVESYADMLKQEASRKLRVSPYVLDTPDPERTKQRLASKCMMSLNLDNCMPGLDWTALHPAVGVPLLREMIDSGHADAFGMPVFAQQPKQPFELGVAGYHELMMQRPRFVGRCVEKYWDDGVVAEPEPFPVIAVSEMAQELLTMRMLEAVLGGFEAGRRLLGAAKNMGLSNSAEAPGADESAGMHGPASWWDLAASHPSAVLGVLLLSKPEMPLGAFLRAAAAARGADTAPADAVHMHRLTEGVDEVEAVSGDVEGGCVWGYGHLTAVGAGDGGSHGS